MFNFVGKQIFQEVIPLFLHFNAFEVTLLGFAGGEYLPLPASKGLVFPFLLTLDGYPTSPANYVQEQGNHPENQETPGKWVGGFSLSGEYR